MSIAEARLADLLDKWFEPKDCSDLPNAPEPEPVKPADFTWEQLVRNPEANGSATMPGSAYWRAPRVGDSIVFNGDGQTITAPYINLPSGSTFTINPTVTQSGTWTVEAFGGGGAGNFVGGSGGASFARAENWNVDAGASAGYVVNEDVPADFEDGDNGSNG